MKTIRTIIPVLLLSMFMATFLESLSYSQPVVKHRTRNYLNRTVLIIHAAKKQLETGKNYKGDFARAVAHQKYARNLFLEGQFNKAVHHSHRARALAFAVIKNNKGEISKEFKASLDEESLQANQPKDDELDRDLLKSDPGLSFDDRAAAQAAEVKAIEEK